jgi:hypothetical protein
MILPECLKRVKRDASCDDPAPQSTAQELRGVCRRHIISLIAIVKSVFTALGLDPELASFSKCPKAYQLMAMVFSVDAIVDKEVDIASRSEKIKKFAKTVCTSLDLNPEARKAMQVVVDSECKLLDCEDSEVLELRCRACFYSMAVPLLTMNEEAPSLFALLPLGFDNFQLIASVCVCAVVWGLFDDLKDYADDVASNCRSPARVCPASCLRAAFAAIEELRELSTIAFSFMAVWASMSLHDISVLWEKQGLRFEDVLRPYRATYATPLLEDLAAIPDLAGDLFGT